MVVNAIEPKGKAKVKVCLDNRTDFCLYKKEINTFNIEVGADISDIYPQILESILIPRAKRRAMHLLERMDRSVNQLERKLADGGYPREAIDAALAYVESYHYTDDIRLAMNHIRFYQTSRSRARMVADLMKKGISRDDIDRAFDLEYSYSDELLARDIIAKKSYNRDTASFAERDRMVRFLLGRGFSYSDFADLL